VTLGTIYASPATASAEATKTVGFNRTDYIYLPERAAVKVGDSVNWSNTVSDENHNVRFEDGKFTEPALPSTNRFSVTRRFSAEGIYRYFCEIHGRDMNGVVYVNATGTVPPDARLRVSPSPAVAGEVVTFDGTATRAGDNPIARYEWDLDGDGMFEKNTGATPTTSKTYIVAQELTARLKVTDVNGVSEERAMPVSVQAPPAGPAPTPSPGPSPSPSPQQPSPQPQPAPPVATSTSSTTPMGSIPTDSTPADSTPTGFSFRAASTARLVKGSAVTVTCSARCRVTATLSISKSVARKARLGSRAVTIGTARGTLPKAGSKTVRVKLTRKARGRLARTKSVRATLKLAVTDASGRTTRKHKAVSLTR